MPCLEWHTNHGIGNRSNKPYTNGNYRPHTETMEVVMSGNVMRVVCLCISVVLFLVAFSFGDSVSHVPVGAGQPVALVSVGFLVSGSVALIAAAMTKPDK
jgi:hypothetical protein